MAEGREAVNEKQLPSYEIQDLEATYEYPEEISIMHDDDTPARKLPQSPETETALLGSLLFDPTVIGDVSDAVSPDDFYVPANQVVAQVIWDLWSNDEPIDPAMIYNELCKRKQDSVAGGHEGLMHLVDAMPEASHAANYARIIKNKALLRQLIAISSANIKSALDPRADVEDVLDAAESEILRLGHSAQSDAVPLPVLLTTAIRQIDEMPRGKPIISGLSTGFPDIDELICGLQKSNLIILAARPSLGKTTLALNIAEHVALEENVPVAIFSLETSADQIATNILCTHAHVDIQKLRSGHLADKDFTKLALATGVLQNTPATLYIDDSGSLTPFQLKTKARRLKTKHGIGLIIVDYLQLIHANKKSRELEISFISRHLKLLAKELDIPILAVSQLSRKAEDRKRPQLSDLRESGAIEQDADVVFLLYRQDYGKPDARGASVTELIVAKQRHGPTGKARLLFLKNYLQFANLAIEDEDGEAEQKLWGQDEDGNPPF